MIQKKIKENGMPFIVIFITSLFLILPQVLNHSLVLGADSLFHFNRIYDIYMQYKTGDFNYFQTNYGFQQSGRIINAVYGPGFAYLLGGILVAVHSWMKFQIITSFLLFFISGYSMYSLSRSMASTKKISLLMAILFMGSFWVTGWEANQNFMSWGIMLMPLVVLVGLKMIKNNGEELGIVPMALTVALVIQVHVLSALMSISVLVVFFIVGMFKTSHKAQLLVKCFVAGALALILTFNVWGSMLEVFTTNTLFSPFAEPNMAGWTMNISTGNYDFSHLGLVMSVIFILQILFMFSKKETVSLANKLVTITGAGFLILSSNIVPWARLSAIFPQLQSFLQFPYRFNGFAMVLLLAGFGATLSTISVKSLRKNLEIILMVGCGLILIQAYSTLQNHNEFWHSEQPIYKNSGLHYAGHYSNKQITNKFTSPNLGAGLKMVEKSTPDYLPKYHAGTSTGYATYEKEIIINHKNVKKTVKNGTLIVKWNAKTKGESKRLPIVVYSNSILSLNNHNLSKDKVKLSTIGSPTVKADKKGENTLTLNYHSDMITRLRLIVVALAWVISVLSMIIFYVKSRRNN